MSRWSKGRFSGNNTVQSLDNLLRTEKENNTLTKAAGSVGKFGTTSFTSIRNTCYNIEALSPTSPNQTTDVASPQQAEEALKTPDPPVVKPRKFFKSRNAVPVDFTPDIQLNFNKIHPRFQPAHARTGSPSNHTNHFAHHGVQGLFKQVPEPGQEHIEEHEVVEKKTPKPRKPKTPVEKKPVKEKVEKPKKEKKGKISVDTSVKTTPAKKTEKSEINSPNKRYLGRTRNKVVNYDEEADEDEFDRKIEKIQLKTAQATIISQGTSQEMQVNSEMASPSTRDIVAAGSPMVVPVPQISPAPQAKIVLRISKGTSRLISTDNEDVLKSPAHPSAPSQSDDHNDSFKSTDELIAILSSGAEAAPQPVASSTSSSFQAQEPKPDRLKIKIKTGYIRAYHSSLENNQIHEVSIPAPAVELNQVVAEPETPKTTKSRRKTKQQEPKKHELYLQPTIEENFDSQSSVLGSISSGSQPLEQYRREGHRVIHSRGSSVLTSDLDTSQQSSLAAAPPSEHNLTASSINDLGKLPNSSQSSGMVSSIEASGESEARTPKGKRAIKKKTNIVEELASIAEGSQEQPTATGSGRVTRNRVVNNNNNEVHVLPSLLLTPPKRAYNRKKKAEEPEIPIEEPEMPQTLETPVSETKTTPRKGRSNAVAITPEIEPKKLEVVIKTPDLESKKRGRKKKVEEAPVVEPAVSSDTEDDAPLLKLSPTPEISKKSLKMTLKAPKTAAKTPEKIPKSPEITQSSPEVVNKRTRKTVKSSIVEMDEDLSPEVSQSTPEVVTPVKRGRKAKVQIVEPQLEVTQSVSEITSTTPQKTQESPVKRSRKIVKPPVPEIVDDVQPEVIKSYARKRKAEPSPMETTEIPKNLDIPAINDQSIEESPEIVPVPLKRAYNRKKKPDVEPDVIATPPALESPKSYGRKKKVTIEIPVEEKAPVVTKTYSRKRKAIDPVAEDTTNEIDSTVAVNLSLRSEDFTAPSVISVTSSLPTSTTGSSEVSSTPQDVESEIQSPIPEYKHKKLLKRNYQEPKPSPQIEAVASPAKTQSPARADSVKMVISKKKGSIFKSRTLKDDELKKRQIYKHQWGDQDEEEGENAAKKSDVTTTTATSTIYDDDFDGETSGLTRVVKKPVHSVASILSDFDDTPEEITSVRCDRKDKTYYTVVRNVKKAHQIQEIGEFQEMDDDVEYILSALQRDQQLATRCLSALQLASKCMTPAFRMHVRAHGIVPKFFKALQDAPGDENLGLCTATVMFVLSQDTLNMDLNRDSLELMLNLLECNVSKKPAPANSMALKQQQERKIKVRELCEEIQSQGKALHLNLDNVTVGQLAMETLLSLTSKRAGEWFKEELRELGGIDHIIKSVCECCNQIGDYVVEWTEVLLEKVTKVDRCLRVLENVSQLNEVNQKYILHYQSNLFMQTIFKFFKLLEHELTLHPSTLKTPKENAGVQIREALVPILKILINMTHPFTSNSIGSIILGDQKEIFTIALHLLLHGHNYVPDSSVFDLSVLSLLLLNNLTQYNQKNRQVIMQLNTPISENSDLKQPAIKALVEFYEKCEETANLAERNTDDILDGPNKNAKKQSQEEVQETVTKLLQKAGNHMEHTMMGSFTCLLLGFLVQDHKENESKVRLYLSAGNFKSLVVTLEKYYNFMNLTASSETSVVQHIKSTKNVIENLRNLDAHSG